MNIKDIPYQTILLPNHCTITVKRIDKIHATISGNKWYKLKYNIIEAKRLGYTQLLSFGGAYSNHIHALAHAAPQAGFESIGIIRGDELATKPLNPTLSAAQSLGMKLAFITRYDYRLKHTPEYMAKLQARFPQAYIIPEGGTNAFAVKGCEQILTKSDKHHYDVIVCAVGTGGTVSGIINASHPQQKVIGYAALSASYLTQVVQNWLSPDKQNWTIFTDDKFGGYAKFDAVLLKFIADFSNQYNIPLEPIYTGKAMYRLFQHIEQGYFKPHSKILFIHTGGLQAVNST